MLPVYSATFLPCLLSILFLPWFPGSPAIQRNYVCTDLPAVGLVNHAHPTSCQKTERKEHGQAHPSVCPAEVRRVACPSGVVEAFYSRLARGRPRGFGQYRHVSVYMQQKIDGVDVHLCVRTHSSLTLAHHPVMLTRITTDTMPHSVH